MPVPPARPGAVLRTPQQVLHLQRTLGNRTVGRLLRTEPRMQRDIRGRRTSAVGTLDVDFQPRSPLLNGGRASESGVISFLPGDAAPDTTRIHLEQLARTEAVRDGLPDLDDLALYAQQTHPDARGAEGGFFVDQVVPDVRARVESLAGAVYLAADARHAYANTGELARLPLHAVIARIVAAEGSGGSPRQVQRETELSIPQLRRLHDWLVWARGEGFLAEAHDAAAIARALVLTVMKGEVDDADLSAATGIDTRVWQEIRIRVRRARAGGEPVDVGAVVREGELEETTIRRDAYGFKKGDFRHPASLYDRPSSKYPIRYEFKTAPIDTATGAELGLYARWGFEIDSVPAAPRVRIRPGSEFVRIEETEGSTYRATAMQARERFDTFWRGEREPHRGAPPPPPPPPVPIPEAPRFRVTGYSAGQYGVFFVHDNVREQVAKPLPTAYNEAVAYGLGSAVGVRQPETTIVPCGEESVRGRRARAVLEAIATSAHADEYHRTFGDRPPAFLMLMDRVPGITLEQAGERNDVDYGSPATLLDDIGLIAAFDLLLFYLDRTSIVGMGNLANVIVEPGDGGTQRGVAIDQRVNVTTEEVSLGGRPLKVIRQKLQSLRSGSLEVVRRLWEDVPEGLKQAFGGGDEGLPLLAASLRRGLTRIAERLDESVIDRIARENAGLASSVAMGLSTRALQADRVDLDALKASLALVREFA